MRGKLALSIVTAICVLCLALVGCGGGSASSSAASSSAASSAAASTSSSSAAQASSSASSSSDNHDGYFVGRWDLYESDEATHEQVVQTMEQYANDAETHAKMNEAYGRDADDEIEFCARFAADGTGEMDAGLEVVPFTWEATNEGAVTFTSFNGKESAIHVPVTDGKFTLNGDTYAKAS
ncbi:MAG: hypothetical protein IJ087_18235 [Eggerthellaceae bacterium]|nr:hypothetical protein [Eggerthellaceae bacterium]